MSGVHSMSAMRRPIRSPRRFRFDLKMTIDKALDHESGTESMMMKSPMGRRARFIDMARAIEGMPRHASTHAAGVVISKVPYR